MRVWIAAAKFAVRDLRSSGRFLWVFWTCLMLGVTLVAASGGLFKQVSDSLLADTRALFGGDLIVDSREPLPPEVQAWIRQEGGMSLLVELRTMLIAGERRPLHIALVSLGVPLALYFFFTKAASIPIPAGILEPILV